MKTHKKKDEGCGGGEEFRKRLSCIEGVIKEIATYVFPVSKGKKLSDDEIRLISDAEAILEVTVDISI